MILTRFRKKPDLQFDMKIVVEYGQGISTFTYQTITKHADDAIASLFTEYRGEKVITFSSPLQGKTLVIPRDKVLQIECNFVSVVEKEEK